ncbi:MAG: NifB/NifX family molybdenum-iron cluster-binding protein, partial [Sphaerochaetaceae bacterium]
PLRVVATQEFTSESIRQKIELLESLEVKAVICGAISREYEEELINANIEVISYVAGDVDDILEAWRSGSVFQRRYSMPGCRRPRIRCRGGRGQARGRGPHWRRRYGDYFEDF